MPDWFIGFLAGIPASVAAAYIYKWVEEGRAVRFSFPKVHRLAQSLARQLHDDGFSPEFIIAIDRNSTIFAGLLAGEIGLRTALTVSTKNERLLDGSRTTAVESGYLSDLSPLEGRKILIFIAFNNTGTSLETVTTYIVSRLKHPGDIRTAAIFSSPSPRLMPKYVAYDPRGRTPKMAIEFMPRMPWITSSWRRVLGSERP